MKRCFFSCIAAACIWLGPLPAALADTASVHLDWKPPVGSTCVPRAVLEQDVERALDRRVFTAAKGARLYVRAMIEDGPSGVQVRLEERNADGELLGSRELQAEPGQCAALRQGIGLVLLLLIERDRDAEPSPLRLDAGMWAGVLLNVLPRAAFGAGPALSLQVSPYVQLRADAAYWLPVAIETARGIRADLHAASLALRICPLLAGGEPSAFSLQLCAGPQLGALITVQTRPAGPATQVRLLAQGLAELRAAFRTGRTARLELAVGPVVSLNRTRIFSVLGDGSRTLLYRVPSLGLILSAAFII